MADVAATLLTGVGASVMTEANRRGMAQAAHREAAREPVARRPRQSHSTPRQPGPCLRADRAALGGPYSLRLPKREADRSAASGSRPPTIRRSPGRSLVAWSVSGSIPMSSSRGCARNSAIPTSSPVCTQTAQPGRRLPHPWQAWIAQGRPSGARIHGSFEDWSKVMGGVLAVAGIDGFLGNLEDGDGRVRRRRGRLGQLHRRVVAAVRPAHHRGRGALRPRASVRPGPEMSGSNDRAMQTSLGMGIRRMKDRMFGVDGCRLRLAKAGVLHGATLWKLEISRAAGDVADGGTVCAGGRRSKTQAPSPLQGRDRHGRETWEPGEPLAILTHETSNERFLSEGMK